MRGHVVGAGEEVAEGMGEGTEAARCLTASTPQITRSKTSTPYYTTDIPSLSFAKVDEPSQPLPGQVPTTSPLCSIRLLDVMTNCIIDNACVWTNITTGALNRLFPNRWQNWVRPTKEALDSATHHPLNIIGKLVKAKIEIGTIEIEHDIQVVQDNEPRFLLGNDLIYDRITIHESRFITVRCAKDGVSREIVPIQYGSPLLFGVLTEDITVRPSSGMRIQVEVQIDPRAANRVHKDYVNRLQGQDISLENIRYGPDAEPDCPIQIEEVICTLAETNKAVMNIINPTFTKLKLQKGTRLARVSPLQGQGAYFIQTHTPQLLSDLYDETGENIEVSKMLQANNESNVLKSPDKRMTHFPTPQALYLHSHDEDIKTLMEGAEDGEMPLPPGYELPELSPDRKEYHISDLKTPYLSEAQRAMVLAVCNRHKNAFAQHDKDVGCCQYEEHDLDVGDSPPVAQTYRPCPRAYVEEATKIIDNMMELGIIEESDSEFGQNLVIVRKPSGALRLCVDLRPINALLVPSSKPAWPIPHVEESFEKFSSAEFVSKLDLTNAYWCLKLTPRSRKVTAFYFLNRLYQFKRAPFGAANLPSVFARVMCKMLRGLRSFSWSFFDDIAVMSTDFESHLSHLERVLERIEEAGFKIRADKCRICVPKSEPLDWLGHIICNGQLLCDPKKVKAIADTPEPKNVDEVIKYVSALNFMSRHYPWFAQVVIPLYNMKVKANRGERFHFGEVEREAFLLSKQMAINAPALELPRYDAELIISSDASTEAAAGMLSMRIKDPETGEIKEVPCGYVSRRFTEAERKRKSVPECEMTALIFTITAFSYYLIGRPSFIVRTDAASLLYLHKFKESNPRLMRAALWLQEYNFTIEHMKNIPGNTMAIADFMSRAYQHAPMVTLSWNNLRNRVFNQLSPPPSWPKKPLNKSEFTKFADIFFESFEPEFPDDTEPLEKLKIQYFLKPSKERQQELSAFQKSQLKGRQKEKYRIIKEKLKAISDSSDQGYGSDPESSSATGYNMNTKLAEPPSEGRSNVTFNQEVEQISTSDGLSNQSDISSGTSGITSMRSENSEDGNDWDELTTWDENELTNMLLLTTAGKKVSTESYDKVNSAKVQGDGPQIQGVVPKSPKCLNTDHPLQIMGKGAHNASAEVAISVPGQGLNSPKEMAALQRLDPGLLPIIKKLQDSKTTQPNKSKFGFKEGVLIFRRENRNGPSDLAIVIPIFMRKGLMKNVHGDGIGGPHLGSTLMFLAMRPYYFWPHMQEDIESFCKQCLNCLYTRPSTVKRVGLKHRSKAPLVRPNQRLAVDLIVGLPRTKQGMQNIFTIIDEFSRYVMMIPCRSKKPEEMAKLLHERWIGLIGVPESIHSDQGTELDSQRISQICQILGIRKTRTPSYSPQSNLAELANKSIGSLLKASVFPDKRATWWVQVLQYVVMAYNETASSVTGHKPRELIFGAIPSFYKLPLVSFEHPVVTAHEFLLATRLGQEFLWQVVRAQEMRTRKPDEIPSKEHSFKEGDFVLVKDLTIGAPQENKLRPKFKGPFRVIKSYPAALLIQKWITPNDRLNTGAILHHHTMNAKHCDARIVHPRDCKPYDKEDLGNGPSVHPKLVSNFLKQLGQLPLPYQEEAMEKTKEDEGIFLWDMAPHQSDNHNATQDQKSTTTSDTALLPDVMLSRLEPQTNVTERHELEAPLNTQEGDHHEPFPYQWQPPFVDTAEPRHQHADQLEMRNLHINDQTESPEQPRAQQSSTESTTIEGDFGNVTSVMIHENEVPAKLAQGHANPVSIEVETNAQTDDGGPSHVTNQNEEFTPDPNNITHEGERPTPGHIDITHEGEEPSLVANSGKTDKTLVTDGKGEVNTNKDDEIARVMESPNINQKMFSTDDSSTSQEERLPTGNVEREPVVIPIKQKAKANAPPPRRQPHRASKATWHKNWVGVKRDLQASENSFESEGGETAAINEGAQAALPEPEGEVAVAPHVAAQVIYENVQLSPNLENELVQTARKNTPTQHVDDRPDSGWTKQQMQEWVEDEIQPELTSVRSIVTAHEVNEIERVLSEAAELSRHHPVQDAVADIQDEDTNPIENSESSSSGQVPSQHDYVNA